MLPDDTYAHFLGLKTNYCIKSHLAVFFLNARRCHLLIDGCVILLGLSTADNGRDRSAKGSNTIFTQSFIEKNIHVTRAGLFKVSLLSFNVGKLQCN